MYSDMFRFCEDSKLRIVARPKLISEFIFKFVKFYPVFFLNGFKMFHLEPTINSLEFILFLIQYNSYCVISYLRIDNFRYNIFIPYPFQSGLTAFILRNTRNIKWKPTHLSEVDTNHNFQELKIKEGTKEIMTNVFLCFLSNRIRCQSFHR